MTSIMSLRKETSNKDLTDASGPTVNKGHMGGGGEEKRIIFLTLNTVFPCLFTCSNELLTFPISIAQSEEIKSVFAQY